MEEDLSSQTAIKSSAIRAIKQSITDQFPAAAAYIDDIIPKKAAVLDGKGKDRLNFVVVDGEPVFYRQRDGPYFPTLRVLHKYPNLMPRVQVDKGAIKYVFSGANIMCPGIMIGLVAGELPVGAPVAVFAEGKEHALAVGVMKMSTEEM